MHPTVQQSYPIGVNMLHRHGCAPRSRSSQGHCPITRAGHNARSLLPVQSAEGKSGLAARFYGSNNGLQKKSVAKPGKGGSCKQNTGEAHHESKCEKCDRLSLAGGWTIVLARRGHSAL